MTRYFEGPQRVVCDAEPSCLGRTLETARPRQKTFKGIDGPYVELSPAEIDAWRAEALIEDGAAWLCQHEMSSLLHARS